MSKKSIIVAIAVIFAAAVILILGRIHPVVNASGCINRLRMIDAAKNQWALEHNKKANDVPTWSNLYPFLVRDFTNSWFTNGMPVCPAGGFYTIGRVGVPPTCSIGGPMHTLPQ
jgi:hypothetical protein